MGARSQGREAALCMLYQTELSGESILSVVKIYCESDLADEKLSESSRRFAEHLLRGVVRRKDELDEKIIAGSSHWRIERMGTVDRNVLRVALFELMDDPQTPAAVILDEAVELAKTYGGPESGAFVNGVLDGIRKRLSSGELDRNG